MLRRRELRLVVVTVLTALALSFPSAAGAGHGTGYWFYQGYLPTSGGARAVHHENQCCNNTNWIRMSWTSGSHAMNFLLITHSGSWQSYRTDTTSYDQVFQYNVSGVSRGGCQNPEGLSTVWVNCRVGNSF